MSDRLRFTLGFAAGLVLTGFAFGFAGVGHGTYAPVLFNASLPALVPDVGILIGFFGTPFLWGAYYVFIPRIVSRPKRVLALCALVLAHLLPGLWLALGDRAFTRALNDSPLAVLLYAAALVAAMLGAALLSAPSEGKTQNDT